MSNDDFSEPGPVHIKAGEEWLVLTCRQCGKNLLLEPVTPEIVDEDGVLSIQEGSLEARCPHCKSVSVYRSDEVRIETGEQRH